MVATISLASCADTPQEVQALVASINSFMARLETALDALRNFTGNASHQLRTPLAVVRTQLALLGRSTTPEEASSANQKATTALERAERVLAQLLVLARVDASTGAAVLHPVDIVAIAKEVTAEMVPAALGHQIDLGFEGPATAKAEADPVLLAGLLKNLVANAISYAGHGAVVTVRVHQRAQHVILEVEDNGPNLSPEQMAAALQSRRGMTRPLPVLIKGHRAGMGLGLAIAGEISDLFDARIELEKAGQGPGLLARVSLIRLRK